jgi:hypothetical protein
MAPIQAPPFSFIFPFFFMNKKLLGFLVLLGLGATRVAGQGTPPPAKSEQGDPIEELHAALANLDSSRIHTGVLLDRMMFMTDPDRFNGKGDTLTNRNGWEQQYWEFYNASLHPEKLTTRQEINERAREMMAKDVMPLLMLQYRYEQLLPDAAERQLITIDSVQEVVFDGPDRSQSPYAEGQFFSVALAQMTSFDKATIYLGKEFWFGNQPAPDAVEVDFSDGQGWRTVPMGSQVEVTFKFDNEHKQQSIWVRANGQVGGTGVQQGALASIRPDMALGLLATHNLPGYAPENAFYSQQGNAKAIAWIKYAASNTTGKLRKPLVFVEGIDFSPYRNDIGWLLNYPVTATGPIGLLNFEDGIGAIGGYRNGTAGWNEMVDYNGGNGGDDSGYKSLEKLSDLRHQLQDVPGGGDYDLIFLDFSDGAAYIQRNAMVLVELLQWINQPANRTADAEETMVIAVSMGGQVARFGLAWMEQQHICHNAKLFVSMDSPNRGANVPMGLQHMFNRLQNVWFGSGSAVAGVDKLRRPASEQMLVLHFDGGATPLRNAWQAWQSRADSYPSQLRKVAVANGNGLAMFQKDMYPGMSMLYTERRGIVTGPNHAYALPGAAVHGGNNVVFAYRKPFSLTNNWRLTTADPNWGLYDSAPGSESRVAGDAGDASSALRASHLYNTFMPTISALDVKNMGPITSPNFGFDVLNGIPSGVPNRNLYAFDDYFAQRVDNEPHVQITNGQPSTHSNRPFLSDNSSWIQNELRESAHRMPSPLAGIYNFGSPYRHLLPAVRVTAGGQLYLNNGALSANGGTAATQGTPATGNFDVYTPGCATVVQVEAGGVVAVGTTSSHTATLRVSANDLLDLRAGRLDVNAGSALYIQAGATLLVRRGATLNVYGRLLIEPGAYLCIEDRASIVVAATGTYTVNSAITYGVNPALGLGNVPCTPYAVAGPLSAAINGVQYTNSCTSSTNRNNYAQWTVLTTGGSSPGNYTYDWELKVGNGSFVPQSQPVNGPVFGVCLNPYSNQTVITVQVWVTCGADRVLAGYYALPQSRPALYPNPANDYVEVANEAYTADGDDPTPAPMQVTVYNGQGTVVYSATNVTDPVLKVATQSWPGGLYQVMVQSGETVTRRQLSVEH